MSWTVQEARKIIRRLLQRLVVRRRCHTRSPIIPVQLLATRRRWLHGGQEVVARERIQLTSAVEIRSSSRAATITPWQMVRLGQSTPRLRERRRPCKSTVAGTWRSRSPTLHPSFCWAAIWTKPPPAESPAMAPPPLGILNSPPMAVGPDLAMYQPRKFLSPLIPAWLWTRQAWPPDSN